MRTALLIALSLASIATAELRPAEKGKIAFRPVGDDSHIAERYRLASIDLAYSLQPKRELNVSGIEIYDLQFPSPVKSPHESNNVVYAEYYLPKGKGPFPAAIVLDILDGSQVVSRGIANVLAQNGVAALCVQMAYYGPRRPAGEKIRLLSPDLERTMDAVRQTVLDNRCAVAWLQSRPEIDAKKVGIHGTSLGSFMAALTAAAEPRLNKVSLLLGGGGLVDAYWDHPQAKAVLQQVGAGNITKDAARKAIAPADPITYADQLKKRDLLMIAASRDDIVPPSAARTLWEATGKQKIIWLDANHTGAALYLFQAMDEILKHFK